MLATSNDYLCSDIVKYAIDEMKLLTTPSTPAHIPVPNSHTNFSKDRETLSSLPLPSIVFDVPSETEREYDHHNFLEYWIHLVNHLLLLYLKFKNKFKYMLYVYFQHYYMPKCGFLYWGGGINL